MIEELNQIGQKAIDDLKKANSISELESIRVAVAGKKGSLSVVLRGMGKLSADERPKVGAVANEWKKKIDHTIGTRRETLESAELEASMASERLDPTLPSQLDHQGALHPLTQTTRKIIEVFSKLGFTVTTGPEIDTEYLTFDAINIPADHPARDMQDTFFMGPGVVLRTHTSPVQMRTMFSQDPPVRILCPGAVYRCDNDATHSPMFHQIEGLWVDKGTRMSDLVGVLDYFAREIFGPKTSIRMRPSYFPFVEPGAEVDVTCFNCTAGSGTRKGHCVLCKNTGWIEILGAGMVHPYLFEQAGYKDSDLTGFAFGMGIERIAMLLYRIPNIRYFYQGDVRFLGQFV